MTGTERLVARALADHRANLDGALGAIRDYQAALTALEDIAPADSDARAFATTTCAHLERIWCDLDAARWAVPPWPGHRQT